jgi:hypothetical protein
MISFLGTLIIGLIVGAIAKLIVPGKEPAGCLVTMAIGVAGSFVAFYLGRLPSPRSERAYLPRHCYRMIQPFCQAFEYIHAMRGSPANNLCAFRHHR